MNAMSFVLWTIIVAVLFSKCMDSGIKDCYVLKERHDGKKRMIVGTQFLFLGGSGGDGFKHKPHGLHPLHVHTSYSFPPTQKLG